MSDTKTIELQRKRNAQIQEELNRLKELNARNSKDSESLRVSELITELENIRKAWLKVLEDLNQERKEYKGLIEDLRSIRETFGKI
jgi:hypothetical protein